MSDPNKRRPVSQKVPVMGIWMSVSERERRLADTASHIVKVTGFSFVIFTAFSGHLSSTKKKNIDVSPTVTGVTNDETTALVHLTV